MQDNRIDAFYLRLSLEDGDVAEGNLNESCSITSQRLCVGQFLGSHTELGNDFQEFVDDGYSDQYGATSGSEASQDGGTGTCKNDCGS